MRGPVHEIIDWVSGAKVEFQKQGQECFFNLRPVEKGIF